LLLGIGVVPETGLPAVDEARTRDVRHRTYTWRTIGRYQRHMLQRIEARDSRLAIRESIGELPMAPSSPSVTTGSVLRNPFGDVAADLRPTGFRNRPRRATYELMVANDTPSSIATFAYAPDATSYGRISWSAIVGPPFSAIAVEVEVALGRKHARPRVVAELFADEAHLTLDAQPQPSEMRSVAKRAIATASAILIFALGVTSFVAMRPRVLALAAPASVRGGSPFTVAYALGDSASGQYVVETPNGLQIRRGTLDGRSGAFTVVLPEGRVSSGYDVRVSTAGRLGWDERTTHVVALPDQGRHHISRGAGLASDVAHVSDLALERDTVHGGEAIVATYRATADSGVVRLIDALGTVRAEAMLNPRGRSLIVAPTVDADQDFRIVATALRGTTHAEIAAPVTVLHGAPALASPLGAPVAGEGTVSVPRTVAPIAVDPIQNPSHPIVVRVDTYRPGLHVSLMGSSTDEIVGADVAPGDETVVLHPPTQLAHARYSIVATYATGLGQETLVRPITFRAP
jgi:hypothetical protein